MKKLFLIYASVIVGSRILAQTGDYPYQPVNFSNVTIRDPFWSPRLDTNRLVTIPFAFKKSEETGRLKNFKVASQVNAGKIPSGNFCSNYGYDDSDVYKIIEGAAYCLVIRTDTILENFLDSLIADIVSAQESDGYLYTMRTINPEKSWAKERWVNDRYNGSHELYNAGHMYEAAVAYYDATGKRTLLDAAIKNADLLCSIFGQDKAEIASGHQEIEIGLVKLYRITGEKKYLNLAKFLLDERGKGEKAGSTYTQDHLPVVEQEEATGHAVRATYMYSAMADIAALTGDTSFIKAIDRIWKDVVSGKLYLTGGIGSRSSGEAYGDRFELPNLTAYNETCAAIANIFWNYRMFLLHGENKYIDVLERTLYNGMLSGVSLSGTTFFYPNPLESEGNYSRSEWFDCSCCPSNVSRFLPSVSQYIYATRADTLFVNLYMANEGKIKLSDRNIVISQTTRYPWDGQVQITVTPEKAMLMTLCLRIPGWARNEALPGGLYRFADTCSESPALFLNGKMRPFQMKNGYALITKTWKPGDMVSLSLPLPVRKVLASDEVKDDKDKVALTRGPIVFCGEGIDNNDTVKDLVIPVTSTFTYTFESDLLNGVGTLQGNVFRLSGDGFDQPVTKHPASLILHPYYSWCHRGAGKMNVWFYTNRYVFPPEMKPANSLFLDEIRIRMKQYQGQEIHYTTGDNYPDKQASLYHDQVVITETTSISAIAYDSENRPSDLIYGNFSQGILFPASTPDSAKQGLICTYYEGRFRRLPDFDTLTPLKSTIVADVNAYTGRDTTDAYALEFEGFLEFPVNGIYDLYVASDDGGRILIDDREVVINDGLHELSEQTGQTAVYKGTHPIRIQFFDYGGEEGLMLSISGPGLPKQRIPKEWYSH